MITSPEKPPNYDLIADRFGDLNIPNAIFAYGDTIFNVKEPLAPHIIAHEMKHLEQQEKTSAEEWWAEYLTNDEFRISQEVEAYHQQYVYICTRIKDKNAQTRLLNIMVKQLVSLSSLLDTHMATKSIKTGKLTQYANR